MHLSISYDHVAKDEMGSTLDVWQADHRAYMCSACVGSNRHWGRVGCVDEVLLGELCIGVLGSDSLTLV